MIDICDSCRDSYCMSCSATDSCEVECEAGLGHTIFPHIEGKEWQHILGSRNLCGRCYLEFDNPDLLAYCNNRCKIYVTVNASSMIWSCSNNHI